MSESYNSSQANFDVVKNADAHAQGIDGGLNLKTDSGRLAPPATTRADNALYVSPGNVQQLPGITSIMPANTSHIYNLHARDLQAPATYGDLMVHGEVKDAVQAAGSAFTSPVWTDGNGASVNNAQPVPPWAMRSRVMTGKLTVADTGCSTFNMMTVVQETYASQATRRYGIGYFDGTNLRFTFGLCDGTLETNDALTYAMTGQYCECAAVQGTNYWIAVVANGSALTRYSFDFTGAFLGSTQIGTVNLATNTTAGTTFNPFTIMQHAGRTFVCYITNPSGANDVLMMYDQVAGSALTTSLSSSTVPSGGFTCFSPYTHQAVSGSRFFAVLFANKVYALGQSAYNVNPVTCGGGVSVGYASSTGSSASEGTVNFLSTGAACIFDSNGGVGASAQLGFTFFRAYPEQMSGAGNVPYGNIWYQSVSVDTFNFTASSASAGLGTGVVTAVASNQVRTASGVLLASKAWSAAPPEANYAGASQAKQAYCVVRCGAWEPIAANTPYSNASYNPYALYGQPTYFVIDHQARIVTRAFESQAPIESNVMYAAAIKPSGNGVSRTTYWGSAPMPTGLGSPMLLSPNNDLSALDITMPLWVQTDQKPQRVVNWAGIAWYANAPFASVNQPVALNLSISNQAASVPPVQAGPYTVLSGPMTCIHDGRGVVEANYHFQAHNPIPIMNTQTGGATTSPFPPGSYYYICVWEWYDSLGRVHRSTPSVPVGVNIAAGNSGTSCGITVPLPPTAKAAVGGVLYMRIYRSTVNGNSGTFYLIGTKQITGNALNNMCASVTDNYIFDPSTADVNSTYNLTSFPRLYTNLTSDGSTVYTFASTPPPPFVWQTASRGRAFGLCQIFGQHRLYYTSVAQDKFPFEWNVYNYAPIPPEIGDVRSIEAIDDKVLIFGTRSNAYLSGTGPATSNTAGIPAPGDGFDAVLPIPTPQGAIGTGGPCRGPDGIYFQGFSGIQLAARDLTTSPVGAAVDAITGRQFNNPGQVYGRAVMLPSLQSIVWPNAAGAALVYNYLTQKWSTWPLLANASCIVQRLDGAVFAAIQPIAAAKYAGVATPSIAGADLVQFGTTYAPLYRGNDNGPAVVLESPWILPSGESGGESQLWDVTCTGSWNGPHTLQVETCINYQANYIQTTKFNFATQPQFYQARVRPPTARVWAVRYRLTLLPISTLSSGYQMATLSDLVVNFGAKQGTTRLGAGMSG
jgi:hypothetical protein